MPQIAAGLPGRASPCRVPGPGVRACIACPTDCAEACFNDAVRRVGEAIHIDAGRCAGCGACVGTCRNGLIAIVQGVARFCSD